MRKTVLILLALGALLAFAAPASAADTALIARLTGKAEVPGPGDSNGRAIATIVLDDSANQVCFALSWNKIGVPIAAHIHKGRSGVAGPILVPLFMGTPTKAGCVDASASLIKKIKKRPKKYYVNIHTAAFPGGAIRGQLAKLK
jgi:hypothetical protein